MDAKRKEEIERLLWQLWCLSNDGSGFGGTTHPMWSQVPRPPRAQVSIPAINTEIIRARQAFGCLHKWHQELLHERYIQSGLVEDKARRRKMSPVTYWRWVNISLAKFWDAWIAARDHGQRLPAHIAAELSMEPFATAKKKKQYRRKRRANKGDSA